MKKHARLCTSIKGEKDYRITRKRVNRDFDYEPRRACNDGWGDRYGGSSDLNYCKKFLWKQVGRKWDDVYSEICKAYKKPYYRAWFCNFVDFQEEHSGNWSGSSTYVDNKGYLRKYKQPKGRKKRPVDPAQEIHWYEKSNTEHAGKALMFFEGYWYSVTFEEAVLEPVWKKQFYQPGNYKAIYVTPQLSRLKEKFVFVKGPFGSSKKLTTAEYRSPETEVLVPIYKRRIGKRELTKYFE